MTRNDILERLTRIIQEIEANELPEINESTNFEKDLDADSIKLTEFIINVEDDFNISIPDEDAEDMKTVGDMITYISNRLN
ncbi:acyl carrier protein [Streptococcus parauberis]|uniref:Acyl carrier protein n=3 Tax=Streptococcus parauberis TaxID=1348 RepID=A0A0E2UDA8_9STRE|nr:acyl carrier protein [Streptococcus parauberis]AEF24471.1 acyl carrier protein [Streptococcus parauberis KCTC 11537]AUT06846.1 Acyl carrier protein [Streptococcus parauberis]EGE54353.1 putative acyl carrier protein [Streptococcus parauberis NCFD 2020]EMF48891.1 Acyl carrier protein [Streptococcus parauberis KRS-02109]EMG24470.1 Acyl carrier protein [Streptococcus parauberis KRS-02083]